MVLCVTTLKSQRHSIPNSQSRSRSRTFVRRSREDRLSRGAKEFQKIDRASILSTVRCSVNRFKAVRRRVVLLIGAEHRLPTTFPLRPSPAVSMHRVSSFPLQFLCHIRRPRPPIMRPSISLPLSPS